MDRNIEWQNLNLRNWKLSGAIVVLIICAFAIFLYKDNSASSLSLAQKLERKCEGKIFSGAWFDVLIPADFAGKGSMLSSTGNGFDSVWFNHPDVDIQLYIYSPQWGGSPMDIENNENVVSVSESNTIESDKSITEKNIIFKNKMVGFFQTTESLDSTTHLTVGYKVKNVPLSNQQENIFNCFKSSVQQYTD